MSDAAPTIASYLIDRLVDLGAECVFGIPGDYVLGFYDQLQNDPRLKVVGTTREDCAGFAADAYARVRGIGAVCVTYCVGGLSVVNSVAGAFAEKSPLVVISGAPGLRERRRDALLHHKVRDFDTQRQVFEKVTIANAVLDDPYTAGREIDRVLAAIVRYKRPGYLELPRDQVFLPIQSGVSRSVTPPASDPDELREALDETVQRLARSQRPCLLVGVEVHRFGLQDVVMKLAEKHRLPICSTLLGKSAVSESHPQFIGVYEGAMGNETIRQYVEDSDALLMIGPFMTDVNLGIDTAHLDPAHCILATSEDLRISHHHYHEVLLADYVNGLLARPVEITARPLPHVDLLPRTFTPKPQAKLTVRRLLEKINAILAENMVVICDVGDSLFAAADLTMHRRTEFLSPAYYTSMGFAIPAALGVLMADPNARPIVLVGDGAFQMTGMELSSILRARGNPIIVILNNKGYTTERFIKDGPYNDILNWRYHEIGALLGGGVGFQAHDETELEAAFTQALAQRDEFSIINAHLDPYDRSDAMERLARRLAQQLEAKP